MYIVNGPRLHIIFISSGPHVSGKGRFDTPYKIARNVCPQHMEVVLPRSVVTYFPHYFESRTKH